MFRRFGLLFYVCDREAGRTLQGTKGSTYFSIDQLISGKCVTQIFHRNIFSSIPDRFMYAVDQLLLNFLTPGPANGFTED